MPRMNKVGTTATTIDNYNGIITVYYHSTPVVTIYPGSVVLNSGGWRTATTKTRMNQAANQFALGFTVTQVKGDWFVDTLDGRIPFTDGMQFEY